MMSARQRVSSILLMLVFAAGSGCGDAPTPAGDGRQAARSAPAPSTPAADPSPDGSPSTGTTPVPRPPVPSAGAPGGGGAVAPPEGPLDPAIGETLYAQNCATCHGMRGAGDGPVGRALQPPPARHDDGAYMNALGNDQLFRVIKFGGAAVGKSPLMAPWGATLDDGQIWDVIAFVRSLAEPPYSGPMP